VRQDSVRRYFTDLKSLKLDCSSLQKIHRDTAQNRGWGAYKAAKKDVTRSPDMRADVKRIPCRMCRAWAQTESMRWDVVVSIFMLCEERMIEIGVRSSRGRVRRLLACSHVIIHKKVLEERHTLYYHEFMIYI
jgi:hypothetical protein